MALSGHKKLDVQTVLEGESQTKHKFVIIWLIANFIFYAINGGGNFIIPEAHKPVRGIQGEIFIDII